MTRQELYESIYKTLTPIIMQDEDIIGCIKRNNFNEKETELFVGWLVNASICEMFSEIEDATMKELIKACKHDLKLYERDLMKAGYGDEVGTVLREVLDENIQEWIDIINHAMKKFQEEQESSTRTTKKTPRSRKTQHVDSENETGKIEETKEFTTLKFYTYYLREVILREDDTIEFLDKYPKVDKEILTTFLTINIFYSYLMKIKKGKITPPENDVLVTHLPKLLKLADKLLSEIAESYIAGNVDANEFNEALGELLNDHFNEFIKKTFKNIFKEVDKLDK